MINQIIGLYIGNKLFIRIVIVFIIICRYYSFQLFPLFPLLHVIFNTEQSGLCRIKGFYSFKKVLSGFLMLCAFPVYSQTENTRIISLADAVNIALQNNPQAKNAELKVLAIKAEKGSVLSLGNTYFNFQYGQINSTTNDHFFEIKQSFGSPFSYAQKLKVVKTQVKVSEAEQQLTIGNIASQVKILWFQWILAMHKFQLITNESILYDNFVRIAKLHFELGEITLLEKTMAETQYADMQNQVFQATENYKLVTNQLKQVLFTTENILPADTVLDLYTIDTQIEGGNKFFPTKQVNYYTELINLKKSETSFEKSKLFPEVSVGYFNQQISGVKGYAGISAGISAPLWFFPQKSKIKAAQIQSDIAENNLDFQKLTIQNKIENLKIQLDQLFVQISFYRENALKQADLLETTARLQFKKQDIEYFEFIQSITKAYAIRQDYFEKLALYNTTAVELEYYIK